MRIFSGPELAPEPGEHAQLTSQSRVLSDTRLTIASGKRFGGRK